jgi:putative peptide zinc metalloprotease protein
MRPDLVVSRETFGGRTFVVLKDPLALRYFRVREEEFALLELLDGRRNLDEIQVVLEARFAPQKFRPEATSDFIAQMHRSGLVMSELRGQAGPLLKRRRQAVRRAWLQKLTSPMSIKLRGIDPTSFFDVLYPRVRWCLTGRAVTAAGLLVVAALTLFAVYHQQVLARLPSWQEFFTPTNTLLMLGLLGAIKVLHEFGHGLTCKHFGGEVHELGVMFLVFAPCLYCNVSDAWRLTKRARIAIGAAGILVELVLAALAMFGWWFSGPGLFHQLCLGTMFVSGVSTVLVNGNPLMRYDGYFILADLCETPNLGEKSSAVVRRFFLQTCLGLDVEPDPLFPETRRGWLALYGIASTVYRFMLTFSIVLFLMAYLRPYRLEVVARVFALVSAVTLLGVPLWRGVRFVASRSRREQMRRPHVVGTTIIAAAAWALFLFLPLPERVWGTLEVEPRDVERIYVDVPGVLPVDAMRPGTVVAPGSALAKLENLDLDLELARLVGRTTELRSQIDSLRRERYLNQSAALRIPELEQSLAAFEELLVEKHAERRRLTLRTARGGVVLPPPETPIARQTSPGELPTWSRLPTDPCNRGATFEAGTCFCLVGDPQKWQALIVLDQIDLPLVAVGQDVEIRFDELPDVVCAGRVAEISRRELSESPRHLSNKVGGELATQTDRAGLERPLTPTYQVRVDLFDPRALLRIGLRGTARIHVPPEPLAPRLARWLSRTFHFQL